MEAAAFHSTPARLPHCFWPHQIAVEGCGHGELDRIYETMQMLERRDGKKIDLLICCGDFQVRAEAGQLLGHRHQAGLANMRLHTALAALLGCCICAQCAGAAQCGWPRSAWNFPLTAPAELPAFRSAPSPAFTGLPTSTSLPQAVRNMDDLECMACPPKYRHIATFYKYYSGAARPPYPTLFSE